MRSAAMRFMASVLELISAFADASDSSTSFPLSASSATFSSNDFLSSSSLAFSGSTRFAYSAAEAASAVFLPKASVSSAIRDERISFSALSDSTCPES